MLITISLWNKIRENFSPEEKALINSLVTGETICPRGLVVDESQLPQDTYQKLFDGKHLSHG